MAECGNPGGGANPGLGPLRPTVGSTVGITTTLSRAVVGDVFGGWQNVAGALRPGGKVLFRDYGLYPM